MERRLLLAVVLSFLVLYTWSIFLPKTKPPRIESPQPIESNEHTRIDASQNKLEASPSASSLAPLAEKITKLESSVLVAEFSNIGGVLNRVNIKNYSAYLPIKNILSVSGYDSAEFIIEKTTPNEISYSFQDADYKIIKTYKLSENDYIVHSEISIKNISNLLKENESIINSYNIDISTLKEKQKDYQDIGEYNSHSTDKSLFEYVVYSEKGFKRKNNAFKFDQKENEKYTGNVHWLGFRDRYFCVIVKPLYPTKGYSINFINNEVLSVSSQAKPTNFAPGQTVEFLSTIYVGPEKLDELKKYKLEFEQIQRFYRFDLFDFIAKLIYKLMNFLHKIIPNWGACIVLISLIIYFSMYPLTMRSMSSMKKMQALQPKMAELREKYKSNPQKLNQEVVELYKKNSINPLGGCLPMFLQMPVFIGLYQVLWRSVSFKGAHFLWIKDLASPDKLFRFPAEIPFVGHDFNLLPIIMMIAVFFQQKITSKNMIVVDPAQASQQKMMGYFMPIMLGVIFYKFSSGLTLYFTMFYLLSCLTQWQMSKKAV